MSSARYEDVCPRATRAGVLASYKQELFCDADDITNWNNKRNDFEAKFDRAKECGLRRIARMKSYRAVTPEEIADRQSHIFPIQVAYTYAKDCLRKLPKTESSLIRGLNFEFDKEIAEVSRYQPNVISKQAFGDGIEQSIRKATPTTDMLEIQELLEKPYYTPEAWNVIYKGRSATMEERNPQRNTNYNKAVTRWQMINNYENLKATHRGKTRKQRKIKSNRKSRQNDR